MRPPSRLIAIAALAFSACVGTPGPGDADYSFNVTGTYRGRFVVQDQRFEATLSLRTLSRGSVEGAFLVSAPVEIDGEVEGVVRDDLLRLTVTYLDSAGCRGTIEGLLTVESGGGIFEGPVTVDDCGEPVAGRMSFRRVDRS